MLADEYREDIKGIRKHMEPFVKGKRDFEVLEAKEERNMAIVIINIFLKQGDETVDIDPIPLLRQDGKWRVVPRLTMYNANLVDGVPNLTKWYSKRKDQLQEQLLK